MSVSLVIATFNHGRLLPEALDSAIGQTLEGVEIVVVDDGSTDDTPAVLARYGDLMIALGELTSVYEIERWLWIVLGASVLIALAATVTGYSR